MFSLSPKSLFNSERALEMSSLSDWVYLEQNELAQKLNDNWHIQSDARHLRCEVDPQYCVVRKNERLIVAFRGTEPENLSDWFTDVKIELERTEWRNARVHQGFYTTLNSIWQQLCADIFSLRTQSQPIDFTGHSLGGALALLAAARFAYEETEQRQMIGEIYTFGQPRTGDGNFTQCVQDLFPRNYFRFVNDLDAVAHLPPEGITAYRHAGTLFHFNHKQVLECNPVYSLGMLDGMAGVVLDIMNQRELQEPLEDHRIHQYTILLEKNRTAHPSCEPHCAGWLCQILSNITLQKPTTPSTRIANEYFQTVANEFSSLPSTNNIPTADLKLYQRAKMLMAQLDKQVSTVGADNLKLPDVLKLELMVLRLLPAPRLLAKAWSVRENYRQLVSDASYRAYMDSKPLELQRQPAKSAVEANPDAEAQYIEQIREDVIDLTTAMHWYYTNSRYREKQIQGIKLRLVLGLAGLIILLLIFSLCRSASPVVVPLMVVLMGMTGAIFSTARRMLPVTSRNITDDDPVINAAQFDYGRISLMLSILIGGLSAFVLYLLMAAGMSSVIPDFLPKFMPLLKPPCAPCSLENSIFVFFQHLQPETAKDFARLLIYSFVAGFAEKFVPDMLDILTHKQQTTKS